MNTREPQTNPDALDALTAAVRAALRRVASPDFVRLDALGAVVLISKSRVPALSQQ